MTGGAKGPAGHFLYAFDDFRSAVDTRKTAKKAGFTLQNAASTLFQPPAEACLETDAMRQVQAPFVRGYRQPTDLDVNWE